MLVAAILSVAVAVPWSPPHSVGDDAGWTIGAGQLEPGLLGALARRELACAACHVDMGAAPPPAPRLQGLAQRARPEFVQRFLAAPAQAQPGTRMPALLAHLAPDERAAAAQALTHYLFGEAAPSEATRTPDDTQVAAGRALFHTVGCVACHGALDAGAAWTPPAGREEAGEEDSDEDSDEDSEEDNEEEGEPSKMPAAPTAGAESDSPLEPARALAPLGHVGVKYTEAGLAAFLFEPLHSRTAGRMPDMGLTRLEAQAIAAYLVEATGGAGLASSRFVVDAGLNERGRAFYDALRCAACHTDEAHAAPARTVTAGVNHARIGCGAADPGPQHTGARFALTAEVRAALGSASDAALALADTIALDLTALRCDACHARAGLGGVDPALDRYFGTTQPDLGEEARIPPPLTHVGAKLQRDWLHRVLFDGARVRPYMTTRMPSFGEPNLKPLADALLAADRGHFAAYPVPVPEGDAARDARDGGRLLLGTTGLGCVTCHDFNGTPSPGFRGLDLITTPERLTPEWYARFLVAPQSLRPGIVMPEAWPGGVAVHTGILGGDTDAQLRGIWYYLTQGRTAQDPPGIRPEPTLLSVDGPVRVYRGRSRVAGFRGIAVGSAAGLHYAFDAEVGALAALWRGDFVSVRWDSQGAGDFDPRAEPAVLQRELGALAEFDPDGAWPVRAARTKEAPRDADPLYARRHGYRFLGYSLDSSGAPTLRYQCGTVTIEERSDVVVVEERQILRRTLLFDSPAATQLRLRLLEGPVAQETPNRASAGRITVEWSGGNPVRSRTDLILSFDLPRGRSTTFIDHDLR